MHRRLLKLSVCAFGLMFASGCEDAPKGGAEAVQLSDQFTQAADALVAKVGAPGEKAEMPAATDAAVKAFDVQAEKALAALGTPALPVDGFNTFDRFCGKTANIVGAYVGAGQSAASSGDQQALMLQNTQRYFDQIFTPLLFSAHCTAVHLPFFEQTIDVKDQSKAEAFRQVRDGSFQQLNGLLEMSGASDIGPEQRRRALDVLAKDAGNFAIILNPAQRQNILAAAQKVRAAVPEESRAQVDAVSTAVSKAPCGKLCSA